MQCPTLAFTVDVCFQLKNRQTKPMGRTCSDSNLFAMQVFITFAEVTGGGAKGRACDDDNSHSLKLKWNLATYRRRVALSVTVTYGPLCMFLRLWPLRYACFSGFIDMPRSLKRSPQSHTTHSIDMAAKHHRSAEVKFAE